MVPSHVERKDARETWQKAWLGRKRWVGEGACSMVGIRLESIGGVRSPQTTILPFFSLGMVLIPASCTMS